MKKICVIFILLFSNIVVSAAETEKIDLKTAMEIAVQNNSDVKLSEIDVEIAKNNIKAANRLQNPSVKTFWNYGEACEGNPNQIGLVQTIELFKRHGRKKLAQANYAIAEEMHEYEIFQLQMDVAEAYVNLVIAKLILKKYERQRAFHEKLLKIANIDKLQQDEKYLDNIEAKIALNQIITEVNKANANAKTARIKFNKILNSTDINYDSTDSEINKNNDIIGINIPLSSASLPNYKDIEDTAVKNRIDIKIAKKKLDAANKNLSVITRQRIPDIEISGGYGFQTANTSATKRFESGAYLEAGLANLPVFYTYKPEIRNAKLEIEQANINYGATIYNAKKDIEIAYEQFVTAQLNLESYNDTILKDSEQLFTEFEKIYRVKSLDFASLAAVEESYQDLVVGYSNALSDYYLGWINFLREINTQNFSFDNL